MANRYEDAAVPAVDGTYLHFHYVNWRGDPHDYVVLVEGIAYGRYNASGVDDTVKNWVLHGVVVSRDGDIRPEMGDSRRRTFLLSKIEQLKEGGV